MLGVRSNNIMPSRSVSRCLFGPVDHEKQRKYLRKELDLIEEENKSRWNFDFKAHTPLSGRYDWERVPAAGDVPEAYRMPQLCQKTGVVGLTTPPSLGKVAEEEIKENVQDTVSETNTEQSHRCATPPSSSPSSSTVSTSPSSSSVSSHKDAGSPQSRKRKQSQITGKCII